MSKSIVPPVGAFVNRPGKGNNMGYTASLRNLAVGKWVRISARPSVAAAIAAREYGAGNYAVRATPRGGCVVYRLK